MEILRFMPLSFRAAYERNPPPVPKERQTEIRLRAHGCASVTYIDENGSIRNHPYASVTVSEDELRTVLAKLCSGSVHTYDEAIRRGYLTPADFPGVRVGVAGRVLCENGRVTHLQKLGSMCIRLPHERMVSDEEAKRIQALVLSNAVLPEADYFMENPCPVCDAPVSTLFYAPPGEGKTTLLRSLIKMLSCVDQTGSGYPALRCAVIDSGEELYRGISACLCDYFFGYPRGVGIALATRAFSPEVLICDEIGDDTDAEDILKTQSSGIPLIATAHADSLSALLRRPCMRRLYDNYVFDRYIRLYRKSGGFCFHVDKQAP